MKLSLRPILFTLLIAVFILWAGCSDVDPFVPQTDNDDSLGGPGIEDLMQGSRQAEWGNNYLWTYQEYMIGSDHTTFEQIPMRLNSMHMNVRRFMEDSPCSHCLNILNVEPLPDGTLRADVEIRHPFLAGQKFTGFDVRLIVIFDGSLEFPESGLRTSSTDAGEAVLLNADGFTNLFNSIDFAPGSMGAPLFEYQKGKYANPGSFSSTLNGYKNYHTDNERHYFPAGGGEVQTLILQLPVGEFRLGYAVNASWKPATLIPPMHIPDDFPIEANCIEPYELTGYVKEGHIIGNGNATVVAEASDWQGIDTVASVYLEAPDLIGGYRVGTLTDSTPNWGEWEIVLPNEKQASPGIYPVLLFAESADPDPNIGITRAYRIIYAEVIENPLEPVWPMFRHDARHTGKSPYLGPRTNNVEWKYWTDDYYALHSSPTISHDGTIFIGGDDKNYYAIYPDGSLRWKWVVGENWVDSSSCIDSTGLMYIVIDGHGAWNGYGTAYAFTQDNVVQWEYETGAWNESSPIVAADGTIVFGARDGIVYALNSDGSEKWTYQTGDEVKSSPAMDPFGYIYIGSHDKNLYCFDADGNVQWTFPSTGPIFSSPSIDSQNRIYFGTLDKKVYCIDKNGNEVWNYPSGGAHYTSPGLDEANDSIIIGSDDNYVYALDFEGNLKWKFLTGGVIRTCPAIDAEGYIYIRDRGSGWKVWCIDPDGNEVWQSTTESEYFYVLSSSPSISNDGSLIVGCSGYAYCFRDQ